MEVYQGDILVNHQNELFSDEDAFRSTDNRGLEPLPEGKALPFVKWAGGKRSISPIIEAFLPENIETYHEPFVGGGAVFFAFQERIKTATLADLNEELILAYISISKHTDQLIQALEKHARNHEVKDKYYYTVRDKQKPKDNIGIAARFLYLNKTCFNGLYRVNKSGKFNVPIGKNKSTPKICNPENLKNVARVLEKATIHVGPFHSTISPQRGDFVYCDPPYDGTFAGYQAEGFGDADQEHLRNTADKWGKEGVSVMVSNSDTPFIRRLYKDYNIHPITAYRHISSKGETRGEKPELLITNYEHRQTSEPIR